jgi:hypothetical protein
VLSLIRQQVVREWLALLREIEKKRAKQQPVEVR